MLVLSDIGYTFADNRVQALGGIKLQLAPGRIHAIIGENGAGKSTLARICTGHLQADSGQIELAGKIIRLRNPAQALAAGLALVPQHPRLAGELKVWQNLVLGRTSCPGSARRWLPISQRAMLRNLQRRLDDWQIQLPLGIPAFQLDAATMHWASIAEALLADPGYLFLDEPSAPYSPDDVERLYRLLRRCADRGMMVVVITHRLQEVLDWVDQVHILRHGLLVKEFAITKQNHLSDLLQPMFDTQPMPESAKVKAEIAPGTTDSRLASPELIHGDSLVLKEVSVRDGPGRYLHGLNFIAPAGQISGLVGIKDHGLEVLEDILAGMTSSRNGQILFGDKPLSQLSRDELAYIPGKRFARGIAPSLSIVQNAISRDRQRLFPGGRSSGRRLAAWQARSAFFPDRSWKLPVTSLSGGMIQRLIFERELSNPLPRLVICAEPWWGLDQRYQEVLLERLRNLASLGSTVVILSSDLDEAIACCDHLTVVRHGRCVLRQGNRQFERNLLARAMVHSPTGLSA